MATMEAVHTVKLPPLTRGKALGLEYPAAYVMDASSIATDKETPLIVCLDSSGSMRESGRDLLKDVLTRLFTFIAESGRPTTVLTYSNHVCLLNVEGRTREELVASEAVTVYDGRSTYGSSLTKSTSYNDKYNVGFNANKATLTRHLRAAVNKKISSADVHTLVDLYLAELFEVGGSTWTATALATAGHLLSVLGKTVTAPYHAQVLLVCDGSEYYGDPSYTRTTAQVVQHAADAFAASPFFPTVSVLALTKAARLDTLSAVAATFNGILAYCNSVQDLGHALVAIFRFMLYAPQALLLQDGVGVSLHACDTDKTITAVQDTYNQHITTRFAKRDGEVLVWTGQHALGTVLPATSDATAVKAGIVLEAAALAALLAQKAFSAIKMQGAIGYTADAHVNTGILDTVLAETQDLMHLYTASTERDGGDSGTSGGSKPSELAREHAVACLRQLGSCIDAVLEATRNNTFKDVSFSLYTVLFNMARLPSLSTTGVPAALVDRFEALQHKADTLAAKRAFVKQQTAFLDGNAAAQERYTCIISMSADDLLGFPARPELKSGKDMGSIEYAATFNSHGGFDAYTRGIRTEYSIPSLKIKVAPHLQVNTGAVVALGPYDDYNRTGYRQASNVRIVKAGGAGHARADYCSDDEDLYVSDEEAPPAGGAGGAGDAVVLAAGGKQLSLAKKVRAGAIAKRLAEGAAKISHMASRDLLPILLSADDVTNKYAHEMVLRKLAAIADGTEDTYTSAWGKYLPLQVYSNVAGRFISGAAAGNLSESEAYTLADLLRTLAFWAKHSECTREAVAAMRAALVSHLAVYKVRAAMASLPSVAAALIAVYGDKSELDAFCTDLWFETVRRSLKTASGQGVANPLGTDPAVVLEDTAIAVRHANRFLGIVRALARAQASMLEQVPLSADVMAKLLSALQATAKWQPLQYATENTLMAVTIVAALMRDDKTYVTAPRSFTHLLAEATWYVDAQATTLDELHAKIASYQKSGNLADVVGVGDHAAITALQLAAGRMYKSRPAMRETLVHICAAVLEADFVSGTLGRFTGSGHMHNMQLDTGGDDSLGAAVSKLPVYEQIQEAKQEARKAKLAELKLAQGAASAVMSELLLESSLRAVLDKAKHVLASGMTRGGNCVSNKYYNTVTGAHVKLLVSPSSNEDKAVRRLTNVVHNSLGPASESAALQLSGLADSVFVDGRVKGSRKPHGGAGANASTAPNKVLTVDAAAKFGFVRNEHLDADMNVCTKARAACIVEMLRAHGIVHLVKVSDGNKVAGRAIALYGLAEAS